MKTCICGKEMGELAHFCTKCGEKLPPPIRQGDIATENDSHSKIICGEMGHQLQIVLEGDGIFCCKCGNYLESPASPQRKILH